MSEIELSGKVIRVNFHQKESGYAIFTIKVHQSIVTVKGTVDMIRDRDTVICKGIMTVDKRPNKNTQFKNEPFLKMTEFTNVPPTDRSNIISHLMESGIKGLGKMTCINIYETFGDDTFAILDSNPERLYEVPKIKESVIEGIIESWKTDRSSHIIRNQLVNLGFTQNQAKQIIEVHPKMTSIEPIKSNPYYLLTMISIKFEDLDYIALKLGIPKTDHYRVVAGCEYSMRQYMKRTGNTIMEYDNFYKESRKTLGITSEDFDSFVDKALNRHFHLEIDRRVTVENNDGSKSYVKYIQMLSVFQAETSLAADIANIKSYPFETIPHWHSVLSDSQREKGHFISGFTLTDEQLNAIDVAINNNICIINGGPGVGKTTTLDLLLDIFKKSKKNMLLCAPTGKAAKRMQETTGIASKTIHRLLEYGIHGFTKNSANQLDCDILVIDEFSMVELKLASHLFDAIHPSTKVIIVGDINQLPSIGAGAVLRDLISSNIIPVARITKIQRQAAASKIIVNSHRVNNGFMPTDKIENTDDIDMIDDFFFIRTKNDASTLEMIDNIIGTKKKEGRVYAAYRKLKGDETTFNAKDNCQVLTPIHATLVGTSNLNTLLQNNLNPDNGSIQSIEAGDKVFRYNDNVMQQKNDHEIKIYNGDAGYVSTIINTPMDKNKVAYVMYKDDKGVDQPVQYNAAKLRDELRLSYAITIHKSQGSEYPVAIIPIPHDYMPNMDRSLIYTALTRGKHLVIMIGSEQQLHRAIQNDSSRVRKTRLVEKLIASCVDENLKPI